MKASEVIQKLQELIASEGDLEVGYRDTEFWHFNGIDKIEVRDHNSKHWADDSLLGTRFIGIGFDAL